MRKILCAIILSALFVVGFSTFAVNAENEKTITMQIDNPLISVNGVSKNIDENGTVPTIIDNRTFIPVRALIESLGGSANWNNETKTAILTYNNDEIKLTVDSKIAYYNNNSTELDTAPVIVNGRTMLPVRFISESFGFDVDWNSESKVITISEKAKDETTEETTEITTENVTVTEESTVEQTDLSSSKVLVVYFSATGTTEKIAEKIVGATNGDMYEIKAKVPYTSDDINYNNIDCRANIEQNDPKARPEIEGTVENMDNYDTVYIGYPIWWGDCPKIICTFMESYDFSNKTVIPFCTSGSSGISTSENTLKTLANANWLSGKRFNANASENEIKVWVDELNK